MVAAATVVAIQASLVDTITAPVLRHVDLPLCLAAVLVLAQPTRSVIIGLIFGLMVDASAQRLFGLHTVAYATLGPLADNLPVPAWRRPSLVVAWQAGVGALAVGIVVATGRAIASGLVTVELVGAIAQLSVVTGLVAIPLSRAVGLGAPFGRRRLGPSRRSSGVGARPQPGPLRPLRP